MPVRVTFTYDIVQREGGQSVIYNDAMGWTIEPNWITLVKMDGELVAVFNAMSVRALEVVDYVREPAPA